MAAPVPRAVVVSRASELEALVARHGTRAQARFFLDRRGRDLAALERRHALREAALEAVSRAIPVSWRRVRIDRADLARFVFEPEDLVVAVGQDGLVANAAKYLRGQLVLGVNPDPAATTACWCRTGPSGPAGSSRRWRPAGSASRSGCSPPRSSTTASGSSP